MLQLIESVAATLRNFVNKAEYVLNVVKWGIESAGKISDILSSFPKPPVPVVVKKEDSNEGAGKSETGNGESNGGDEVQQPGEQLASNKQNGNGRVEVTTVSGD